MVSRTITAKNRGSASAPSQVVQTQISKVKLPKQKVVVDLYFTKNEMDVLQKMAKHCKETLNGFVQEEAIASLDSGLDYRAYFGDRIIERIEKKFQSKYPVHEADWTPDNDTIKLPVTLSLNRNQAEVVELLCRLLGENKSEFIVELLNSEIPGLMDYEIECGRMLEMVGEELKKQWELDEKKEEAE